MNNISLWIKKEGVIEFTTGAREYEDKSSSMLNQELSFYSNAPAVYEKCLKDNNCEILLRESDQEDHLVWIVRYLG